MILFCFLDGIGADFRSLLVVESEVAIQQFDPGGHRSRLDPELVEISMLPPPIQEARALQH